MKRSPSAFLRTIVASAALLLALLSPCPPARAQTALNIADSVQTYATLTNTTVTMTGTSELHITGTSSPVAGSTINLNSHYAWVFFDNLRPTTGDNYLGQIKVNGATAVNGTNVRVVQFGMGTVICPYSSSEQPLQTFSDPNFVGASKLYSLYTYYNTPAALGVTTYSNISSFKLKRGFMATFASQPDGTGTSKVYIAQDHDVNIASLPSGLFGAVQFVRVFPWRWVSKKGTCDTSADTLNAEWHYDWNNDQSSTENWEYVPIRQQRYWPGFPTNSTNVTCLSGFNEPNNSAEDAYTTLGNGDVDTAVSCYPAFMASGLRVGAPAVSDSGQSWLFSFMDKALAAGIRIDYIPIHFYRCGQSAADLQSFLQTVWNRYHLPMWVTEFNNGANWTSCADPTYSQEASVIGSWIDMMDSTPWIERYAVYSNVEATRNMIYSGGGLTPAGQVYHDQQSPVGYQQEAYPVVVQRGIVELPLDGDTRDTSGYGNGGISQGAPVFVPGHRGQALQFDGSSFYTTLPAGVVNSGAFTFAAWVYWNGGSDSQRIFDFGNDTTQFIYLSPGVGGKMNFGIRSGSSTTVNLQTNALPSGSWQHVAVTMSGTTATIYVNGVQQATGTLSATALSSTVANYLGKSQWSSDPLFSGKLDDVFMADSAYTQAQVAALMTGNPPLYNAYWKGGIDGNWSTNNAGNTNWTNGADSLDAGTLPGSGANVIFAGSGANNVSGSVLGADFSVAGLTLNSTAATGIGGANSLTVGTNGITVAAGAGAATINTSGQVKLGANQTWTNNSSNALTVGSVVSGSGFGFSQEGAGTVVLNAANTYTGKTTLYSGTLAIGNNAALGTGTVDLRGTTLQSTNATARTLANPISLSADTVFGGPGNLLFTGAVNGGSLSKALTINNAQTEFSGVISGSGARTKAGAGTLVLSGANTYTGATTVSAGTLRVTGSLVAGSAVTVASGATLTGTGAVRGATSFAKSSHLQWSLAANSATAGQLTTGTLSVTSGALVDLIFNGAGSTTNFADAFWSQPRSWTVLGSPSMIGTFTTGTVTADSTGNSITNCGKLTVQQSSTGVTLAYTPYGDVPSAPAIASASALPGRATITWAAATNAATYNVKRSTTPGGPYTTIATGVTGLSYTDASGDDGVTYYYIVVAANAGGEGNASAEIALNAHQPSILDKADNSASLNQTASWVGGVLPDALDAARWSGLSGANSVSLGSNVSVGQLIVAATGGPVSIAAGNTLTLGTGGIDLSAATQNLTISSGLTLSAGNQTWNVASGQTLAIGGTFARSTGATLLVNRSTNTGAVTSSTLTNAGSTGIVGPWAVVKSAGTGANNVAGGSTYATMSSGSLAPFTGATAAAFSWTSTNGNTFNYDLNGTTSAIGVNRVANTLRYTGAAGTQNYGSSDTATVTLNGLLNAGTGTLTLSQAGGSSLGQVVIGTNNGNELDLVAADAGLTIAVPIVNNGSTAGSVAVAGASVVTLSGANLYTGGTTLAAGTLTLGSDTALGTGALTLVGGTLQNSAANRTIANALVVPAGAGTNVRSGGTASGQNFALNGGISGGGNLDLAGAYGITRLTLGGNNASFSGTATVSGVNVALNSLNAGSASATWVVNSTLQLNAGAGTYSLGSLAGASAGNIGNLGTGAAVLSVGALNANTVYSGTITNAAASGAGIGNGGGSGTVALTKVGMGTLTLTGTSTYTGATTVNAGTLMLNGTLSATSAVAVNNGGTLAGTGTSSGAVTVDTGATLAPGNGSGGVLTLSGALTLNDGSALNVTVGASASSVGVGGTFTSNGVTTINVTALNGFNVGTYPLLNGAAGVDPSTFAFGAVPAGYAYALSANNGTLSLTVMPVAPWGLTAVGSSTGITLNWSAFPYASGYNVKRSTTDGAGFAPIASSVTGTSYTDNSAATGTTYYYVVSAVSAAGESADSSEASAVVMLPVDQWRWLKFGTTLNAGNAADGADPDGDGLSNLMEYALGTEPLIPSTSAAVQASVVNGRLTISFTRNTAATDVVLSVWATDDLASGAWDELALSEGGAPFTNLIDEAVTDAVVSESGNGAVRAVQVGDAYTVGDPAHPKRFLVVRVQR